MSDENVTVPAELYLQREELLKVKLNSEKIKSAEKDKLLLELKKNLLDVQSALLASQGEVIKRDRVIMGMEEKKVNENIQELKDRSIQELEEISKDHEELEGKTWGYNPETGEIIINEELQTTP